MIDTALSPLDQELQERLEAGMEKLTIKEIEARLSELGYKLNRDLDCRSMALDVESGRRYPCITTSIDEKDTGRSFANVESRRDANFDALQKFRLNTFAVVQGSIFDL